MTDSSDNMGVLFVSTDDDSSLKKKRAFEEVTKSLLNLSSQDKLTDLDKRLLKGFYTNSRYELGNMPLLPKGVDLKSMIAQEAQDAA